MSSFILFWTRTQRKFSPLQFLPSQWYDPSKLTGLSNSDPCALLPDLSVNGRNMTAAAAARPTYTTSAIKNLAALDFDGSANAMSTSAIDYTDTGAVTFFAVIKPTIKGTNNWIFELTAGSNDGFYVYHGTDGRVGAITTGNVGNSYHNHTTVVNGTVVVVSALIDKTTNPDTVRVWINGITAGTPVTVNNTNNFGERVTYLGKRSNNSSFFDGLIGPVIVIPSALSDTERGMVESYLSVRFL